MFSSGIINCQRTRIERKNSADHLMEGVPLDGRFSIFTAKRFQGAGGNIVTNFLPFAVRSADERSRTDTDLRWGFDYRKGLLVSRTKRIAARSSFHKERPRNDPLQSRPMDLVLALGILDFRCQISVLPLRFAI